MIIKIIYIILTISKDFFVFDTGDYFVVKKFLIGLILVLLVAFGGLSYYVSTIDWNRYKDKITTQIEDVTGKKVVINGRVGLKFLPTPHLNATDIAVYNPNNVKNGEPLAQIKK